MIIKIIVIISSSVIIIVVIIIITCIIIIIIIIIIYIDRRIYLSLANQIKSPAGLKALKPAANGRYLMCKFITLL